MPSLTTAPPETQFYSWQNRRCAYSVRNQNNTGVLPLVLVHPIGVGLSRAFWYPFEEAWQAGSYPNPLYNLDLLGCGDSDMPSLPYHPQTWAAQLLHFLKTVVGQSAVVAVQGALFPAVMQLAAMPESQPWLTGLILSGPPAWRLVTTSTPQWQHQLSWLLFASPLGAAFFRYARREAFLQSFSQKQLFAHASDIDRHWLDMLQSGAESMQSRHAVFAFLAGFWRQNYEPIMRSVQQPTLVVMGQTASSISREGKAETPQARLDDYLQAFPNAQGVTILGRNVLPYESAAAFAEAIAPFVRQLSS